MSAKRDQKKLRITKYKRATAKNKRMAVVIDGQNHYIRFDHDRAGIYLEDSYGTNVMDLGSAPVNVTVPQIVMWTQEKLIWPASAMRMIS